MTERDIEELRRELFEAASAVVVRDAEVERLKGELQACGLDNEAYFNRCEELAAEVARLQARPSQEFVDLLQDQVRVLQDRCRRIEASERALQEQVKLRRDSPLLVGSAIVPARMSRLPRDARGYPIPYAQWIGADGKPDFRVLDGHKVGHCLRFRLCGLCGEQMGRHLFFIGGALCVANGLFHDPPMHRECAEFALRACIHLASSKGRYSSAPYPSEPGLLVVEGAMASDQKVEWFALMHTTQCTSERVDNMIFIKAKLPWIDVQRWRDGAPMIEES